MRKANDIKKQLLASERGFWADQPPKDNNSVSAFFGVKFKSDGLKH